jgi:hypothetical protein
MDARFRSALWSAIRKFFPGGAEMLAEPDTGMLVQWSAEGRWGPGSPHARPVAILASSRLAEALAALDDERLCAIVRSCRRVVLERMTAYRDDGTDDGYPIVLSPNVLQGDGVGPWAAAHPAGETPLERPDQTVLPAALKPPSPSDS